MKNILIKINSTLLTISLVNKRDNKNLNNTNIIDTKELLFSYEYIRDNIELVSSFINTIILKNKVDKVRVNNIELTTLTLDLIHNSTTIKKLLISEDKIINYDIFMKLLDNNNLEYINCYDIPPYLLDRIDIHIEVTPVKYQKLQEDVKIESSSEIKKRVNEARKLQINRYKEYNLYSNAELTPSLIEKYCKLDSVSHKILQNAFEKLGLSARAYGRILKVARTIADLEKSENIKSQHIAEAIQYRSLDRKYF